MHYITWWSQTVLAPESSDLKSVNERIDMRNRYKRVFDLSVIIITYILLCPLWLIVWIFVPLAIRLEDRGPVFYAQERIGWRGKHFKVLKYRTMIQDAERQTAQVWAAVTGRTRATSSNTTTCISNR